MGTDGFIAPEIRFIGPRPFCFKSDVWGMGVILMQLLFKKEYVFTQKMIVYDSEKKGLVNIKNPKLVLILQLAVLFGSRRLCEFLVQFGFVVELPLCIDMQEYSRVMI